MATPKQSQDSERPVCFVIMPISDVETYQPGHFRRVYDHLIVPACEKAGFVALLGSDVKPTNMIVLDVLQRLHSAEMVLCDLSSRNPNVLFELGFRQAFNKPVTLIKDQRTERIFDISGLRDIQYDESLRIDVAQTTIAEIAERMRATFDAATNGGGGVNSLVQLLGVESATVPERTTISAETQIVLDAVQDLNDRLRALEPVPFSRKGPISGSGRYGENLRVHVMATAEGLDAYLTRLHEDKGFHLISMSDSDTGTRLLVAILRPGLTQSEAENMLRELGVGIPDLQILGIDPRNRL